MTARLVLFDTTTLSNFAAVDRLDLLATTFGGRAGWTAVVADEFRRGARAEKYLRDLDTGGSACPASHPTDQRTLPLSSKSVGRSPARYAIHTTRSAKPTMYYIETCAPKSTFVTDDRAALDLARRHVDGT